jgi:hypothetical protein
MRIMKPLPSYLIVALLTVAAVAPAQHIDKLVDKIKAVNEVHHEGIGFGGIRSEQYENYIKLSAADTTQLVKLTDNENGVVACYASWALIDKSYNDLPGILSKFLNHDKNVMTFSGCIKMTETLSSQFYHRYWNSVANEMRATDKTLFMMDSIILYHENPNWLLTLRALENRLYPRSFNRQIEVLAFEKTNRDAIFYLSNWYKAEYAEQVKLAWVKYLRETEFKNVGVTPYYDVVAELLKYKDDSIRSIVIEKLKKDKHWQCNKTKFNLLLQEYYIYPADVE